MTFFPPGLASHPAKSLLRFPGTSLKPFTLSLLSSAGIESNVLLELLSAITTQSVFPPGIFLSCEEVK